MTAFQYPWLLPREKAKVATIRGRWIDRSFGVEYTKFENQKIKEFDEAYKKTEVEISGFVSWIDSNRFLLLPTRNTNTRYIICKNSDGVDFPPNYQYINCKGNWKVEGDNLNSVYKILQIENFNVVKPDFGTIKSDMSLKEFQGNLFDGWTNIDNITKNFLVQKYASSPILANRAGGLTVSLFNHPRQRILVNLLHDDLRRSFAPEILGTKNPTFTIDEIQRKHRLPPFGWTEETVDFNNISNKTNTLLSRIPESDAEYSISLLSQKHTPDDLNTYGLAKSDYPIAIEDHVERKHNSYSIDLKATQFIIATHMNTPSIDSLVFNNGIQYVRDQILEFINTKTSLTRNILGHNQMLDLGIDGRPLSAIILSISRGRANTTRNIKLEHIKTATADYISNLDTVFRIWEDRVSYGKIHPLSTLNYDEERALVLLHEKGALSIGEIGRELGIKEFVATKLIDSLLNKGAIYCPDGTKYSTI